MHFYLRLFGLIISLLGLIQIADLVSIKRPGTEKQAVSNVFVSMPGLKPDIDEQYTCYAQKIENPGYIVNFIPTASSERVHHMLLYGCKVPGGNSTWNCLHHSVCGGMTMKILYAWARNAPPLSLPKNVGVPVGPEAGIDYYVLQVHYSTTFIGNVYDYSGVNLQISTLTPPYVAGIYLLLSGYPPIPADTPSFPINTSCKYEGNATVYPFAYRTHTHGLGRIVTGYKYRDSVWTKIGKGNPQWPQRFYDVEKPVKVLPGDTLAAQCIYNSTGRHTQTYIGATGADEMCNFYMYYYVNSSTPDPFGRDDPACLSSDDRLFESYPKEASIPFTDNEQMTQIARASGKRFGVAETKNWPAEKINFGQIGGLTFDMNGNLVVFHRAGREWNEDSFDLTNHFRQRAGGPIMDDTVLTLNSQGSVIKRWGKGFFYMPHGIFMDSKGFLWATDVAMHQVFKFDLDKNNMIPALTLGKEFQPGSDREHFCKPSAVAVTKTGLVFIADGYCNNRIVKFDPAQNTTSFFGETNFEVLPSGYQKLGAFNLPHALALHESKKHILVADRENNRVQIFDFNGLPIDQLVHEKFGGTVYGVSYCEQADIIYVINGQVLTQKPVDLQVFAFSGKTKRLMFSWQPQQGQFQKPHCIASSADCKKVFVGEIGPNKLWRFEVSATGSKSDQTGPKDGSGGSAGAVTVPSPDGATGGPLTDVITIDTTSWSQILVILSLAIAFPILCIAAVCCCCRFRKQGGFKKINLTLQQNYNRGYGKNGKLPLLTDAFYGRRSHKGFQPLRTEDIDAMDDLTDDSEAEDTLYKSALSKKDTILPANA